MNSHQKANDMKVVGNVRSALDSDKRFNMPNGTRQHVTVIGSSAGGHTHVFNLLC